MAPKAKVAMKTCTIKKSGAVVKKSMATRAAFAESMKEFLGKDDESAGDDEVLKRPAAFMMKKPASKRMNVAANVEDPRDEEGRSLQNTKDRDKNRHVELNLQDLPENFQAVAKTMKRHERCTFINNIVIRRPDCSYCFDAENPIVTQTAQNI